MKTLFKHIYSRHCPDHSRCWLLSLDNNQLESPLHENFVKQVLANPKLIRLTLARNNFGLGDCQAIHVFIARGGWADEVPGRFTQGLLHSPQNTGFDFTTVANFL